MKRRKFSADFKTRVVLEALKEQNSIQELAQKHELHPQQITAWKKAFLQEASQVFTSKNDAAKSKAEQEKDQLLRIIGELKVENDFLKKSLK